MKQDNITIVIPVYNEAESIESCIRALRGQFPKTEIIVVDDGSEDQSAEIAENAGARVVKHHKNSGYGASLKTGVRLVTTPYVVFCDGDGQHSASDIARLIEITTPEHDMVVGVRTQTSHVSKRRWLGKTILYHFANFLADEKIPDFNSGLRVVKKEVLMKYFHLMPDGFSMSTTMTFAFLKSLRNIAWIPITVVKRKGKSTVRQMKHGPQTMLLMLRLTVLFEPLKVFLTVANFLFWLGLVSAVVNMALSGWQSIGKTTVIFCLASLMVFMFGLLCDQISALRREIHE
ncbi:MAG: glycosyltransferase family 2 protein [Candidatus Omnitrophica bacterium]|nr:glycosyltransferase family 2 protein [Candidatus Omnitrophota bacterium]